MGFVRKLSLFSQSFTSSFLEHRISVFSPFLHPLLSRSVSTFSLSYCIRSPTLSFEVPYLETSKDIRGTNLFSFSKRQEYPNRKSAIFHLFRLHQRNIKGCIASAKVKVHSVGQEALRQHFHHLAHGTNFRARKSAIFYLFRSKVRRYCISTRGS